MIPTQQLSFAEFAATVRETARQQLPWFAAPAAPDAALRDELLRWLYGRYLEGAPKKLAKFAVAQLRELAATPAAARASRAKGLWKDRPLPAAAPQLAEPLPAFRYHPNPLATGSVKPSGATCLVCNRARGAIYVGPVYAEEELDSAVCPWCIASGDAHRTFGASFTDPHALAAAGLPRETVDAVAHRTPGYSGWQQEEWLCHCGDAARFLGRAGSKELRGAPPEVAKAVQESAGLDGRAWEEFLAALRADGSPTAYVFQCTRCARYLAYTDSD